MGALEWAYALVIVLAAVTVPFSLRKGFRWSAAFNSAIVLDFGIILVSRLTHRADGSLLTVVIVLTIATVPLCIMSVVESRRRIAKTR